MTTAKSEVLIGFLLKKMLFNGGNEVYWGKFWLERGTSLHPPSKENAVYWIYFENYFASGKCSNA